VIDPVLPWLEDLRSRIWGHKELRPQIFRTVKVTRAHYNVLQRRLKELYADRDSPGYNGTKANCLQIQLDFLRSLPQHSGGHNGRVSHGDGSEESSEGEIESLFPSIINYLDLSTLGLKEKVPNRLPLPLLIRQEYQDITDLIEKAHNDGMSVIVSGQPGIGELFVSLSHRI